MAHTPSSPACKPRFCPVRAVAVHLLDPAGQRLRLLFLDRQGHFSAKPHLLPQQEALILAANQRQVLGAQAQVRLL